MTKRALRVVHLAYYYGNNTSGAPVAATRLHHALLRAGVDSHFICVEQRDSGVNVHAVPKAHAVERLFYLVTRAVWVVSKLLFGRIVMANVMPLWGFTRVMRKLSPDVVHIHMISQDMVSFAQLKALPYPMVATLHDFTLINALDPHPQGDKRFVNGFMRGNSRWIERWVWNRKRKFIEVKRPLFSAPSMWAASVFSSSFVGRGQTAKVIPNPTDRIFRFSPELRSSHTHFRVIYGAFKGRSTAKGWDDLVASLDFLPEAVRCDMEIHVFGEKANATNIKGVRVEFLGGISNSEELMRAYHQVDVCAFPSKMETQGQVKIEALLCGLPVLAFDRTACAEGIGPSGWIAADGDLHGYADGLLHFYNLFKDGSIESLRHKIAEVAAVSMSEEKIVSDFIALYNNAVSGGSL